MNTMKQPHISIQPDSTFPHKESPGAYHAFVWRGSGVLLLCLLFLLPFFVSCSSTPTIPTDYRQEEGVADIYPDYKDIVIPPNIAPLNFIVRDAEADAFVVGFVLNADDYQLVTGAGSDGKIDIDTTAWRALLTAARGQDIGIDVYARRDGQWHRFKRHTLTVAEEDIDPYLSYRLIEPGYELYRQLGLYQRNLTDFDEQVIYENNRTYDEDNNHCVNCHNYQNYDTQRMLFHVRGSHGGTVIAEGAEAHKIAIKHDSILGAGVYPSWHPTLPLVAFSTNMTGQVFHMQHAEKIEVLDESSDLLLYDVAANTVRNIPAAARGDAFETFPCWNPAGDRLYYCSADMRQMPDSLYGRRHTAEWVVQHYDSVRYDLWSIPFDAATRTFGTPQLEVACAAQGKSASVPRVSPDGRYLLYTLADYGQFHIWHKSADLWILPLDSSAATPLDSSLVTRHSSFSPPYPLTGANSPDVDSYHTWSSNGRWIVFSSRRDDGTFTRPYIAYFDKQGQAHRAFLLPQRDPEYNQLLLKSYNVPELTRHPVQVSRETLSHVVMHTEAEQATFQSNEKK